MTERLGRARASRPTPDDLVPSGGRLPDARSGSARVMAPRRLRASWQRSRTYGVSPDRVQPVFVGSVETDDLLYECGSEVLRGLASTVSGEPISFMVTDADGLVLLRLSEDNTILRSLDRVHLAPGFQFGEQTAGTNGLGLALADRAPALVRGREHYCAELRGYTCAAVPVLGPAGDLAGSINLTTWSEASSDLLLALAQAAAGTTAAMMRVRATGMATAPVQRGERFRVMWQGPPAGRPDVCHSRAWRAAVEQTTRGYEAGGVVALVGEPGVGKTAAATLALRSARPGYHVVRAPLRRTDDAEEWLARWLPELAQPATCVLVNGLQYAPAWAAHELSTAVAALGRPASLTVCAEDFDALPPQLTALVDTVVEVAPLRHRPDDILPLARLFAANERRREVEFGPDAEAALLAYDWPGNAGELSAVARAAAARSDRIGLQHLNADVFARASSRLTRLERLERDEIVRCLTEPGVTMGEAANTLGLSRATLYRKVNHYRIVLPGRLGDRRDARDPTA